MMNQLDPIPSQISEHCNQPEPVARTIESLTVHELSEVATGLAEELADGKILKWYGGKFLCDTHIHSDLADDVRAMHDLVALTLEQANALDYLIEKFNVQARERIVEMLEDMNEMPRGYDLEDYL